MKTYYICSGKKTTLQLSVVTSTNYKGLDCPSSDPVHPKARLYFLVLEVESRCKPLLFIRMSVDQLSTHRVEAELIQFFFSEAVLVHVHRDNEAGDDYIRRTIRRTTSNRENDAPRKRRRGEGAPFLFLFRSEGNFCGINVSLHSWRPTKATITTPQPTSSPILRSLSATLPLLIAPRTRIIIRIRKLNARETATPRALPS